MPLNAIHPLPVTVSTGPTPPIATAPVSRVHTSFENASNTPRAPLPESRGSSRNGCGCLGAVLSRIRNVATNAFAGRTAQVAPAQVLLSPRMSEAPRGPQAPSTPPTPVALSREASIASDASVALSRQTSVASETSAWASEVQELLEWAQSAGESERESDGRMRAYQRIQRCLANPDERTLDISGLDLSEPPPDLPAVQLLRCANNHLRALPEFPESLLLLDFSGNPLLEDWPVLPPRVIDVDASGCGFSRVAGPMPASLRLLNLSNNRLTQLPTRLPTGLMVLNLENNQLTRLPGDLPEDLPLLQEVHLHGNPLDPETRAWMEQWNETDIHPRFILGPSSGEGPVAGTATLEECERTDALTPERAFHQFVARLKISVNAVLRPELVDAIDAFRDRVTADAPLFDRLCAMAFGANASCEDRPTLLWLDMLRAEENTALNAGRFDGQPPTVIDILRHNQRMAEVDRMAADIVDAQGPHFNEAIETHLHLRLAVADLLPQNHGILAGRYASTTYSGVTDEHIAETRERLGQLDAGLRAFALASEDWQDVLRRAYPKAVASEQKKLEALAAGLDARTTAYLRAEHPGSEDDPDQFAQAAAMLMERDTRAMWERLTQRYEKQHGVSLGWGG